MEDEDVRRREIEANAQREARKERLQSNKNGINQVVQDIEDKKDHKNPSLSPSPYLTLPAGTPNRDPIDTETNEVDDPIHDAELIKLHGARVNRERIPTISCSTSSPPGTMTPVITSPSKLTRLQSIGEDEKLKRSSSMRSLLSTTTMSLQSTVNSNAMSSIFTEKHRNDLNPYKYVGYFRDNWNIIDFIIVITSWIEIIYIGHGESSSLTPIRVLRVLRPLRTFTKVPALKRLIMTIIESLKGLKNVLVLLLFLFVVFAIIGVQTFKVSGAMMCDVLCFAF